MRIAATHGEAHLSAFTPQGFCPFFGRVELHISGQVGGVRLNGDRAARLTGYTDEGDLRQRTLLLPLLSNVDVSPGAGRTDCD